MFSPLKIMLKRLITKGNLSITGANGSVHHFGDGQGSLVHVRFNSSKWEREVAYDPALKLGEAYMEKGFDFIEGDMYELLRIIFESTGPNADNQLWMRFLNYLRTATKRLAQMNNLRRSSSNVRRHYDLSGQLYKLFLDSDQQYSCGYFETPDATLEEAQLAKKRHLAAKLGIKPGHRILDIGSGWGGLSLYMARYLGAEVTGVTLSHEQNNIAVERAKKEGLDAQCHFLLQDYRSLNEPFDRIISVGMFEHIGVGHYKEYFNHVKRLLKPDGVFMLHSIGRNAGPSSTNPFIRKYIFPGGYIPALSEVFPAIEKSGLVVNDIEILRLHYAKTLNAWRQRFMSHWDEAKSLYDDHFCRMWEFYLAASESAFRWQNMMVFQIQLSHYQEIVPITRSYIANEEERLKKLDSPILSHSNTMPKNASININNSVKLKVSEGY